MSAPQHCPGYEKFKELSSFICTCTHCGAEKEIFSDEFDRQHRCPKCGQVIDCTRCLHYAGGKSTDPR